MLFVDLDFFKRINDSRGHAAGDRALQTAARRLTGAVRESDTVGRFGGDEFLVILPDIDDPAEAALVAAKMLAAMSDADDKEAAMSASIGIALYPQDGLTSTELLECADKAMYRAKAHGGGYSQFYDARTGSVLSSMAPLAGAAPWAPDLPLTGQWHQARLADLREANEHLVLAAMSAQALQSKAEGLHERHVMFLAMVAHELRNPLNPIRMATELLEHAQANAGLLAQVPGHLATPGGSPGPAGRRPAGRRPRQCREVQPGLRYPHAGRDSHTRHRGRPARDRKRQQTLTTCLRSEAVLVHADPLRLAQVFSNLLENASKYTPRAGAIDVALDCVDGVAAVRIGDTGIGISAEALPQVFELFVQEPRARAHDPQGLGLGLAIVRALVEAHGGTIVASSPGRDLGSTFVVTLPVLRDDSSKRPEASDA